MTALPAGGYARHYAMGMAALRAGAHVFMEKPFVPVHARGGCHA
jgi:hypothetical protein